MKTLKKNLAFVIGTFIVMATTLVSTNVAFATLYYHANGGSYWSQSGPSWSYVSNDGYCVSGRGPCGSGLWYQQWTYNHAGCEYDEWGKWNMSAVVPYNGQTAAWIDGAGGGTMTGADYVVTYNYGNAYRPNVNQNIYYEQCAALSPTSGLYRTSSVNLTDGWSTYYACNSGSGKRVEFDEVRLNV